MLAESDEMLGYGQFLQITGFPEEQKFPSDSSIFFKGDIGKKCNINAIYMYYAS